MTEFEIKYLADHPEHIQACAAWAYGRWGVQNTESSLQRALNKFQAGAQTEALPLTVLAVKSSNNLPVAMGSLWSSDGEKWDDLAPWIASIFTHYRYRNLGLASRIVQRLEQEALRLGYETVYLKSGSAVQLYEKLNYQIVDKVETTATMEGTETLFLKRLSHNVRII